MIVWMDGECVPYAEAGIPPLSHSLGYASSVYEGIRSYGGRIFELGAHLRRLRQSAATFLHSVPWRDDELAGACAQLLAANGLVDAYLKVQLFYDDADLSYVGRDCSSRLLIAAVPAPVVRPAGNWSLAIAPWRRPPATCHPYGAKTSSTYALSLLSHRAKPLWADDVVFLCGEGRICEASGSNIFFVRGDRLVTPTTVMALAGITRQLVIDRLAPELGLEVEVRDIHLDELAAFDGAFLCGTAVEIKGVVRLGEVRFPESLQVERISSALREAVVAPGELG